MDCENSFTLNYSVKVALGDDLRRFAFSGSSYAALEDSLRKLFNLSEPFIVKYLDDEKEWISMSSDGELLCAVHLVASSKQPLRLMLVPNPSKGPSFSALASPNNNVSDPMVVVAPSSSVAKELQSTLSSTASPVVHPQQQQDMATAPAWTHPHHGPHGAHFGHQHWKKEGFGPHHPYHGHGAKGKTKLVARFVKDVTVEENTSFAPGTSFVKTWRMRNEGSTAWQNCMLKFKKGERLATSEAIAIAPLVSPGQEVEISVPMTAPQHPGKYAAVWKLADSTGIPFGQAMRVKIRVTKANGNSSSSSSSEEEKSSPRKVTWKAREGEFTSQLVYLEQMGFGDRKTNLKLLCKFQGNIDQVVVKLLKRKMKFKE